MPASLRSRSPRRRRRLARRAAPAALAGLLAVLPVTACGTGHPSTGQSSTGQSMTGHPSTGQSGTSQSSTGMTGMTMGTGPSAAPGGTAAGGITPIPTQLLGSADWQGMKITADAMTVVPFITYNGATERTVRPSPNDSFHLMVQLADAQTKVPIPYASVWATITKGTKTVFDQRQWPMLSRYVGPHYGNDVPLPGAGTYTLTLRISPPAAARHMEYQNVWLKPHQVSFTFRWKPPAS